MLSATQNELLTRSDQGTPMGGFLRHFWMPILLSRDLPEPDYAPVKVTVMGEKLVAFRDSNGRVGLVQARCPHRGADLFWGRNEECGLRCSYHGLKFDIHGECIDVPMIAREGNYDAIRERLPKFCQDRSGLVGIRLCGGFTTNYAQKLWISSSLESKSANHHARHPDLLRTLQESLPFKIAVCRHKVPTTWRSEPNFDPLVTHR